MRPGDHYAVDLDGVLAYAADTHYVPGWIGPPIPAMMERVKAWRAEGIPVVIFTARVSLDGGGREDSTMYERFAIEHWCYEHLGEVLPITCEKSWRTARIYDDRAIAVERNTGRLLNEEPA